MAAIPVSYEQSRQRFHSQLDAIRKSWPLAQRTSQILSNQDDLSIDWISANALTARDKLFVLTTGEHGIEGYAGAALLELFIEQYLPRLDPQTTGILLVHAINPWGMKHWKRNNAQNVDLNRNFIDGDFSALANTNPDYSKLASFLSPQKPLGKIWAEKLGYIYQTLQTLASFGVKRTREAALMGQYGIPQGIYFGGQEVQRETRMMMELYRSAFAGYSQVVHLDMHTGYGPRFQMTLVNSPHEKMNAAETTAKYGIPLVAAANPDEFYTMQGDMIDWEYQLVRKEFPGARIFAATCEFGTFGESILAGARSLRITIFKNQVNLFGASPATRAWVEQEYRELYLPAEPKWFEKVRADAQQTFEGVLGAEGFFNRPAAAQA